MSFSQKILILLSKRSGGYRLLRQIYSTYPSYAGDEIKDHTFRVTLSRLKKYGLAENEDGVWDITRRGLDFLSKGKLREVITHGKYRNIQGRKQKSLIISFDIPEVYRKKRDWLRVELVNLGFVQLHKSVWFGPAPLPIQFINSLKELKILSYVKFFAAHEQEVI